MECSTCYGYGFWAWGDRVPMGSMDASDGFDTLACPECKANPNPVSDRVRKTSATEYKENPPLIQAMLDERKAAEILNEMISLIEDRPIYFLMTKGEDEKLTEIANRLGATRGQAMRILIQLAKINDV